MDRLKQFFWSRLTGEDPKTGLSLGMIPVGPGELMGNPNAIIGPTRGVSEGARRFLDLVGKRSESQGGVNIRGPFVPPREYSIATQAGRGDPSAFMAPLSDMNIKELLRSMGSLTPSAEGRLAERLAITPSDPGQHAAELLEFIARISSPMFRRP